MNPNIRHNYNNLMVGYYRDRIDALIRKIEQLENMLEFKQIQIEKLEDEKRNFQRRPLSQTESHKNNPANITLTYFISIIIFIKELN